MNNSKFHSGQLSRERIDENFNQFNPIDHNWSPTIEPRNS
jgi:hypothetical protein